MVRPRRTRRPGFQSPRDRRRSRDANVADRGSGTTNNSTILPLCIPLPSCGTRPLPSGPSGSTHGRDGPPTRLRVGSSGRSWVSRGSMVSHVLSMEGSTFAEKTLRPLPSLTGQGERTLSETETENRIPTVLGSGLVSESAFFDALELVF